ncbi:MAG TPA: hypothetical protein VIO64_21260, partial [Pseudobacteroides sp.]|uniref:hypothetical protein n=1 Tax=Pseudobacteroides sp. TaxID=1968840 RepID=UPI002F9211AF
WNDNQLFFPSKYRVLYYLTSIPPRTIILRYYLNKLLFTQDTVGLTLTKEEAIPQMVKPTS